MKLARLQEITTQITDGKHGDCNNEENSGYYFVSCKDVYDGSIHYEQSRQITRDDCNDVRRRIALEPGDSVITNSGTIGRMAFATDRLETYRTAFQKSVAVVKPRTDIVEPEYLYYLLLSCVSDMARNSNGSAQKNLLLSTMREYELSFHESKDMQRRLVEIISAYDSLIENNRRQIALLEEAAQRLYREWFVDLRFPGHENTEISEGLPNGWAEKSLAEIADVVMGQSPKSEYYNDAGEGLPFHQGVSSYGLRFVQDETYTTSVTRIGKAGSILFSVRAPVGRLNYTKNEIVLGRGLAAMNHRQGLQSYLFYMLKERFFKENMIGNGSIFASISKGDLLAQKFIVPDSALAERFDLLCRPIDGQIARCDDAIKAATEARDRLLPKLMSGEVEV